MVWEKGSTDSVIQLLWTKALEKMFPTRLTPRCPARDANYVTESTLRIIQVNWCCHSSHSLSVSWFEGLLHWEVLLSQLPGYKSSGIGKKTTYVPWIMIGKDKCCLKGACVSSYWSTHPSNRRFGSLISPIQAPTNHLFRYTVRESETSMCSWEYKKGKSLWHMYWSILS